MLANIPGTSTPFQVARLRIHAKIQTHMEMLPLVKDSAALRSAIGALQFALREIDTALGQTNHTAAQLQTGSDIPPCLPERSHNAMPNLPHEGMATCKWCGWVRPMTKGERISEGKRKGVETRRAAGIADDRADDERGPMLENIESRSSPARSVGDYMSLQDALLAVDTGGSDDDFS